MTVSRQRGFKPKAAKSKSTKEAIDALAAAFPGRSGQFPSAPPVSQPETHWSGLTRVCKLEWCEGCEPKCDWECCHCTCSCHDKE